MTEEEKKKVLAYIREHKDTMTRMDMAKELGLSRSYVQRICIGMGLHKASCTGLTLEQKLFIDHNWQTMSYPLIAEKTGANKNAIRYYVAIMGYRIQKRKDKVKRLNGPHDKSRMQHIEDYIRENHGTKTLAEMAKDLGMSIPSVAGYERRFGLNRRYVMTKEQMDFVDANWQRMQFRKMAEHLGVPYSTLLYYTKWQGYRRPHNRPLSEPKPLVEIK